MIVMPSAPMRNSGTAAVYVNTVFTEEECDRILETLDDDKWEEAMVGGVQEKGVFTVEKDFRSNYQQKVPVDDMGFPLNRIAEEISRANSEIWRFDLGGFAEDDMPWVMDYCRQGDHNDWHVDLGQAATASRKLGFSLQLTEGSEYEGGDLGFHRIKKKREELTRKGTLIVFPSFWLHRVAPMTKGARKVVVGWVHGPSFR
ncbi:2OG-Fe(II) oxygenase family protein [Sneathiella limimaris]|uniref:2OG-Fe(II) oxygenase family protein n=1 Tax=Sneathiella limimaris TaxID=1964213 RepID=UPI00146C80C0|nr:2OG-Fe(II) oxygenase [Sneathiella limimaris]